MVFDPTLATSQLCLLLNSALGLGVDVSLNGDNLALGRCVQQDAEEKKGEKKRPHVTAEAG
jgi:hypothetical protein